MWGSFPEEGPGGGQWDEARAAPEHLATALSVSLPLPSALLPEGCSVGTFNFLNGAD